MRTRGILLLAAALPLGAMAASLSVSFKAPTAGAVMTGVYKDSPGCEVTGNNIRRVEFFLGTAKLNTELNPAWHCSFDSTTFANGPYALKAVAYDKRGRSATAQVNVTIHNNVAPAVSFTAPDAGATLSGALDGTRCAASASDSDGSIAKVDFYLDSTLVTSRSAAPYECAFDSAAFPNGTHTLMALATDNEGASTSAQRSVNLQNGDAAPPPSATPVDAADIITQASADVPFAQQSGYTAQVINTYTSASAIPESGIHGSELPNGETLRFGKVGDPLNSVLKALAFQVHNSDPTTSGGKRAELKGNNNIEMNKVYWIAFSAYIYDWGTLSTTDKALFGTQVHQGKSGLDVGGPSVGLFTTQDGRSFRVQARYSESSTPTESNSVWVRYAEYPIPFGRWADFVFKFKHNTSGNGFLQVWMDGNEIANHQGSLGYNTGVNDYIKFGYYNWSGSAMGSTARKLLLRSPTLVADPTGGKYTPEQLRAYIQGAE